MPKGRSIEEFLAQHPPPGREEAGEPPAFLSSPLSTEELVRERRKKELKALYEAARLQAREYLSVYAKSSGQIRKKLGTKGYPKFIIDRLLRDFEKEGLISDLEYAKSKIRQRSWTQTESKSQLAYRLQRQGFPLAVVQQALEETGYDDFALLTTYLEQRFRKQWHSLQAEAVSLSKFLYSKEGQKLLRHCASRGFSPSQTRLALEAIWDNRLQGENGQEPAEALDEPACDS